MRLSPLLEPVYINLGSCGKIISILQSIDNEYHFQFIEKEWN